MTSPLPNRQSETWDGPTTWPEVPLRETEPLLRAGKRNKRHRRKRRAGKLAGAFSASLGLSLWSLCAVLPVSWASAFGAAVAGAIAPFSVLARRILENIEIAFPALTRAERRRLMRAILTNAGRTYAEYPHLGRLCDPAGPWLTFKNPAILESSLSAAKPVIFVTGHIGNWELLAGIPWHLGRPVTAVYSPLRNAWLDARMNRYRRELRCQLIPKNLAARGLITALRNGDWVGLVIDQGTGRGIDAPFFGRNAPTWSTPARLALRYGADIIPMYCRRVKGSRFEVTFGSPIKPSEAEDERSLTAAINRQLEAWIESDPAGWFCLRPRWPRKSQRRKSVAPPSPEESLLSS
jgi:KDO2-lipid IV(A) lauroyltransferase